MKYSRKCKECERGGLFTLTSFPPSKMPLEEKLQVYRLSAHFIVQLRYKLHESTGDRTENVVVLV